MIKPIETVYNGYRFRSRLEARWAVFLDAFGINYQYEMEGYKINVGENDEICYLPDFFLPDFGYFVEVKGTDEALASDSYKIACAVDYQNTPCSNGLLILGDIPNPEHVTWGDIPIFSFLENHKGIVHTYAAFMIKLGKPSIMIGWDIVDAMYILGDWGDKKDFSDCYADGKIPENASTKYKMLKEEMRAFSQKKLKEAYAKARQARFEHGEKPFIK